ncbi:MAG: hypothetical protein HUU08_09990 [Candidatus Brocadia sp.]|nr:hypothetical protein [Candidatus Brocadia sp.]
MKVRFSMIVFIILSFFHYGIQIAYCEFPNSEMSREEAKRLFTDANEKYLQAAKFIAAKNVQEAEQKLKDASLQYETILAHGFKNGQIYYNLGNTYYRQGELGKAILNYHKAERLLPRNADLDANLRLAKGAAEDKELSTEIPVAIQRIFFWFFLLNQNELSILTVSLYVMTMIALFFFIIRKHAWLKRVLIGLSAALLIVLISLGGKIYMEHGVDRGVVVTTKCEVRYGPGEEYEPKFEVHNGAECVIEDENDDWYRVYVKVGIKQDTDSKTSAEGKVSKDMRRGWLQKKYVDVI